MGTENQNGVNYLRLKAASVTLSAKDQELHFRFQHYLMKHSSVNGLVNDKTVSDLYDMLLENSRKYLDIQPAAPSVGSMQSKGKDYPNTQKQSSGRNFLQILVSSVVQWITG